MTPIEAASAIDPTPAETTPSWSVLAPADQTVPLVFASPHSGDVYPPEFVAASWLDPVALRRSEDAFVDRLFAAAAECGAPLLRAHFPRAYVDPNREPFELDPAMFDGPLPDYVNTTSPRVVAGLGTVARVVTSGENIYRGWLVFDEVRRRIDAHYFPYHATLEKLIADTVERFGACVLVDCHSMPSVGGPMDADTGLQRVDAVLGDCHATSCASSVTDAAEQALADAGFVVGRNMLYAGGFTTRHYGRPADGVHALQIEINRALYMDEDLVEPGPNFGQVAARLQAVVMALATLDIARLRPA